MGTLSLFDSDRLSLDRSIELTVESLRAYGALYRHWAIAFSGGKDSAATVTLVADLLEQGAVPRPDSITVLYADTRQELPPLHNAALALLGNLRSRGFDTRIVLPKLDHRYFVYILGRGVPPPSNTFRWCTPKLKVMSMERELEALRQERGEKFLMLTGVRIGESAARDQRIALSCTKDGGECGQGWFQHTNSTAVADVLAPLLHWRVCHVWDWLVQADVELGYPTFDIAEVYGHDPQDELGETEPMNARTGCIGCPLVQGGCRTGAGVGQSQMGLSGTAAAVAPPLWGSEEAPISPPQAWGTEEGRHPGQKAGTAGAADPGDAGMAVGGGAADSVRGKWGGGSLRSAPAEPDQ
jgi:DNA sulfur modification protein DndC